MAPITKIKYVCQSEVARVLQRSTGPHGPDLIWSLLFNTEKIYKLSGSFEHFYIVFFSFYF